MAIKKVKLPDNSTQDIHDVRISGVDSTVTSGSGNVVTSGAVSTALTNYQPYEALLQWGGKNHAASYSPVDAAMVGELGACRTMFPVASGIVIEYSRDGGTTWQDYGADDAARVGLFSCGNGFYTGKNTSGAPSPDYMLRVTLYTNPAGLYTVLNKFVFYITTNGSGGCYCTIRGRTQDNYENNVNTWTTFADQVPITGWSGWNVINTPGIITYGNTKSTQYGEIQFIFGYTSVTTTSYPGLMIIKIFGFGGVGWVTPSYMARNGHLYTFDALQNATFPRNISAVSFIKSGGTSSQFLKADGSVDSNTYATTSSLGNYLPLAGGNMTGAGGIQYPTTSGYNPTHFISAGGGYSAYSGKDGIKIAVCDQNNVVTGMGQDLTGFNYELSIVTGVSGVDTGYITFAKHNIDSPTTYTRLGYFDSAGNLTATGDVRANGNDVYVGSSTGSQCHQQYDDTNKCLKFIFD